MLDHTNLFHYIIILPYYGFFKKNSDEVRTTFVNHLDNTFFICENSKEFTD